MEAKQYANKKPIDYWRNQRGNPKVLRQMKTKALQYKTDGMQQKQF